MISLALSFQLILSKKNFLINTRVDVVHIDFELEDNLVSLVAYFQGLHIVVVAYFQELHIVVVAY
jgi:hypothetical protein